MHWTSALWEKHILIAGRWLYNGQQVTFVGYSTEEQDWADAALAQPWSMQVHAAFNFRTNINAVSCKSSKEISLFPKKFDVELGNSGFKKKKNHLKN